MNRLCGCSCYQNSQQSPIPLRLDPSRTGIYNQGLCQMSFHVSGTSAAAIMERPEAIHKIFRGNNPELLLLVTEANRLEHLQDQLSKTVPQEYTGKVRVSTYKDRILTLQVDSPVWASRLRYRLQELLKLLAQTKEFANLLSIQMTVQPPLRPTWKSSHTRRTPDHRNAALLESVADSLGFNPELARSLRRLAKDLSGRQS